MRRVLAAAAVLLAFTTTPAHAATRTVGIANFGYHNGACPSPSGNNITTISVGDTVSWANCDPGTPHTVTADDGAFDSGDITTASYSRTFNADGFFYYHCERHPSMKGSVVVQAAPTATTRPPNPIAPTTTIARATTTTSTTSRTTLTLGAGGTTTTGSAASTTTTSTTEPDTTPIADKDSGANGGLVGLILAAIAAVIGGGFYVVRRMRSA